MPNGMNRPEDPRLRALLDALAKQLREAREECERLGIPLPMVTVPPTQTYVIEKE